MTDPSTDPNILSAALSSLSGILSDLADQSDKYVDTHIHNQHLNNGLHFFINLTRFEAQHEITYAKNNVDTFDKSARDLTSIDSTPQQRVASIPPLVTSAHNLGEKANQYQNFYKDRKKNYYDLKLYISRNNTLQGIMPDALAARFVRGVKFWWPEDKTSWEIYIFFAISLIAIVLLINPGQIINPQARPFEGLYWFCELVYGLPDKWTSFIKSLLP